MASISPAATVALQAVIRPMLSPTPTTLTLSESAYYLGDAKITLEEVATIARVMQLNGLEPENTRILKSTRNARTSYEVLQASAQSNTELQNHVKGSAVAIDVL